MSNLDHRIRPNCKPEITNNKLQLQNEKGEIRYGIKSFKLKGYLMLLP